MLKYNKRTGLRTGWKEGKLYNNGSFIKVHMKIYITLITHWFIMINLIALNIQGKENVFRKQYSICDTERRGMLWIRNENVFDWPELQTIWLITVSLNLLPLKSLKILPVLSKGTGLDSSKEAHVFSKRVSGIIALIKDVPNISFPPFYILKTHRLSTFLQCTAHKDYSGYWLLASNLSCSTGKPSCNISWP